MKSAAPSNQQRALSTEKYWEPLLYRGPRLYKDLPLSLLLEDEQTTWNHYVNRRHISQNQLDRNDLPMSDVDFDEFIDQAELPEEEQKLFQAVFEHEYLVRQQSYIRGQLLAIAVQLVEQDIVSMFLSIYPDTSRRYEMDQAQYEQGLKSVTKKYKTLIPGLKSSPFTQERDDELRDRIALSIEQYESTTKPFIKDSIDYSKDGMVGQVAQYIILDLLELPIRFSDMSNWSRLLDNLRVMFPASKKLADFQADWDDFQHVTQKDSIRLAEQVNQAKSLFLNTEYRNEQQLRLAFQQGKERSASRQQVRPVTQPPYRDPGSRSGFRVEMAQQSVGRHKLISQALSHTDDQMTILNFDQQFIYLEEDLAARRTHIIEKTEQQILWLFEELRKSRKPEIRQAVEHIDSIFASPEFRRYNTRMPVLEEQFMAVLEYENEVNSLRWNDLDALVKQEMPKILPKIQPLHDSIRELERKLQQVPDKLMSKEEYAMLEDVIQISMERLADYRELIQRYKEIPLGAEQTAGILFALEAIVPSDDDSGRETGKTHYGEANPLIFDVPHDVQRQTYARVKALEAAYLTCRDVYREKLEPIVK